jgi:hypothetical protein
MIHAGDKTLYSEIHKLIPFRIRKNCFNTLLPYLFIRRVIKLVVTILMLISLVQMHTKCYKTFFSEFNSLSRQNY